jgi:NAD(P)-dependent dehydrogenase (short-subunit alcohol dehydrogenase family)
MSSEQRRAMFDNAKEKLPVQRVGASEDIAQAILFVATNPYATGSVVTVDGGANHCQFQRQRREKRLVGVVVYGQPF